MDVSGSADFLDGTIVKRCMGDMAVISDKPNNSKTANSSCQLPDFDFE